ncbi:MAG: HAD-IIA family hydrolase [Oscillospiraceae bacterium]|nr:HAD-IIA family hydrolase [Oscillospiraceae bacterium]MCI8716545.1 HAD-IIA family hydrolase [Oscillospiraceae bacterium]
MGAYKEVEPMGNLGKKRLFLLDMDGTIYLDQTLFPGTLPFLEAVRARGGRYLFLTNNSSKSVDAYVEKLGRMGVAAGREDFLTSADALIADLAKGPGYRKCYVFGTESFRSQLREAGVPVTDRPEKDVDCLLIGFDTELTFQKLEDACILLGRGVDFIATNPDWVCPTWYGSVPDCGSVCEMLFRAAGRRPRVIGKPQPAMALLALERTGFTPEQAVMVGDRLYTDIAGGVNAGIDTAFVLSGEGRPADLETSPAQPTWVFADIAALHRAWISEP